MILTTCINYFIFSKCRVLPFIFDVLTTAATIDNSCITVGGFK